MMPLHPTSTASGNLSSYFNGSVGNSNTEQLVPGSSSLLPDKPRVPIVGARPSNPFLSGAQMRPPTPPVLRTPLINGSGSSYQFAPRPSSLLPPRLPLGTYSTPAGTSPSTCVISSMPGVTPSMKQIFSAPPLASLSLGTKPSPVVSPSSVNGLTPPPSSSPPISTTQYVVPVTSVHSIVAHPASPPVVVSSIAPSGVVSSIPPSDVASSLAANALPSFRPQFAVPPGSFNGASMPTQQPVVNFSTRSFPVPPVGSFRAPLPPPSVSQSSLPRPPNSICTPPVAFTSPPMLPTSNASVPPPPPPMASGPPPMFRPPAGTVGSVRPLSSNFTAPPPTGSASDLNSFRPLGPGQQARSYPTPPQPTFQAPMQLAKQSQFGQNENVSTKMSYPSLDSWNKAWGTDHVDLLQHRHVLPTDGVRPPKIAIAQDFLKNCDPDILRCTFTKIPETKSLLQKAKMPFGILIHPFKDLDQLPVVSCQQIVRCRSCRTYINPFVVFRGERRWECNLCYRINDLPEEFQYDPLTQTYGDPSRRPEVREATIEYIAPSEYMLRPPQPAVYLWLFDTSRQAIDTGYLKHVCDVLKNNLTNIPGDKRTLIGVMTFSATVQFYLMPEGGNGISMLEVGDLDDMFLPYPDELLVNREIQREQLEELFTTLPMTHANSPHTQSALGPALTAAYKLLAPLGGRITVFTSNIPSIGPGSLKPREDPNQRAAADVLHLNPATDFYKKLALDCSGQQVAIDLFALNSEYIDLATLSGMSKFSGGCIHHFPNFHAHTNPPSVAPFLFCLNRYITRKIGFEAVMRIRANRGLTITNFHGHFFVRSPDLLSLPNINPDAGFAMQVAIEEPLHNIRSVCFQAALLYTSSRGERRIRVHTLCLPVTANLHDVVYGVDQQAAVALLARMAVDRCQASTATDARDALVNACIDALSTYRNSLSQSPGRALVAPHNLKLWPLYTLALLKSIAFRSGLSTKLDDRVFAMCDLKTLPTKLLIKLIYPDLYPVHDLNEIGALNVDDVVVPQPPLLQLSAEYLNSDGAYLADSGHRMVLYIRSGISSHWLQQVMGVSHFNALPHIAHQLPDLNTPDSHLLNSFICHLNRQRPFFSPILILREDSAARLQFTQLLVEDRIDSSSKSYVEFIQYLSGNVK